MDIGKAADRNHNVVSLKNHLANFLDNHTINNRPASDTELEIIRRYSTLLDELAIVLRSISQQWEIYIDLLHA